MTVPDELTNHPLDDFDKKAMYGQGRKALSNGKYNEAIEEFNKLPKTYRDTQKQLAEAHYQLGRIDSTAGNYQDAIEKFKTALGHDPDRSDIQNELRNAYRELAHLQLEQKDCDQAIKTFQEAKKYGAATPDIDNHIQEAQLCKYLSMIGLVGLKDTLKSSTWKHLVMVLSGGVAVLLVLVVIVGAVIFVIEPGTAPATSVAVVTDSPVVTATRTTPVPTNTPLPPTNTPVPTQETLAAPAAVTSTNTPLPDVLPLADTDTPTPIPATETPTPTPIPATDTPVPPYVNKRAPVPATNTPTPIVVTGKIAVPVFNNSLNTYDLYVASGPDWQPTLFQNGASQPAFSPDGNRIMFRSWGEGNISLPTRNN